MRIAIAGNIGSGKTSLTKQLSKSLKYKPYYEDVPPINPKPTIPTFIIFDLYILLVF